MTFNKIVEAFQRISINRAVLYEQSMNAVVVVKVPKKDRAAAAEALRQHMPMMVAWIVIPIGFWECRFSVKYRMYILEQV